MAAGDGLASYRQNPYAYGGGGGGGGSSKGGYYPTMSGWASTYQDDAGVDYGLNYSSYQILNPEPSALVSGYNPYGGRKSVYVDPEASASYTYGSLTHRPAVPVPANGDSGGGGGSQGFSLSSMAASLPMPSPSDRLHSSVNRTLTSSSNYRGDGLSATPYANSNGGKASSAPGIPDVTYGNLQPAFESAYPTASTLASAIAHRATAHADATYPTSATAAATGAADHHLYGAADQPIRSTEDAGVSYIYSDSKLCGGGGGVGGGSGGSSSSSGSGSGSRRDSPSGAGAGAGVGSLLSNGHAYVPESHSAHHPAAHAYVVPGVAASSSRGRGRGDMGMGMGATTPVDAGGDVAGVRGGSGGGGNGGGGGSIVVGGSSHRLSDSHNRRSAGSLRGG